MLPLVKCAKESFSVKFPSDQSFEKVKAVTTVENYFEFQLIS